jgi:Ca-activated chloride channel homolog
MTPLALSFHAPLFLLALLLVPLVLLAQMRARRRAQRYAVRFTAVPTLAALVGTTPAWRRHLPTALALAALAALALALAQPHSTIAVPIQRASVVLVTDHSRSMMATDVEPTRLEAARRAAESFLRRVPPEVRVGAVAYSDAPDAVQSPTQSRDDVSRIIDSLVADGSTATGDALGTALDALDRDRDQGRRPPSAIVLLSDGKTTTGHDPVEVARRAGRLHIPIYTVALGTEDATIPNPYPYASPLPVPPDPETLRRIAQASGGRAFTVEGADELSGIYQRLGSQIGTRRQEREITAWFAIGGLLLLGGAALASLRFAGRLP